MENSSDAQLIRLQKNELTAFKVYDALSRGTKNAHNRRVLEAIAADQLNHWSYLKSITRAEVQADEGRAGGYLLLARFLGMAFALKHMENSMRVSRQKYIQLLKERPELYLIWSDQERHEREHLSMIVDERLAYAGAIVLGLNDAIVEFTGALSGFTLALQNGPLIGLSGLIMGIAASLSMAASGYQEGKENEDERRTEPLTAAVYTGSAYFVTVLVLISPYFLFENVFVALGVMLALSVGVILAYTFYISTAKGLDFRKRFVEMAAIALIVAGISFIAGWGIKQFMGIDA